MPTELTVGTGFTYATIQAAHDAIPADPAGDYTIRVKTAEALDSSLITLNKSNSNNVVFLLTADDGVMGCDPDLDVAIAGARVSGGILITGSGWIVEKLYVGFSGTYGLNPQVAATVRRCTIAGPGDTGYGVNAEANGTKVQNCVIVGCAHGILGNAATVDSRMNSIFVAATAGSGIMALSAVGTVYGNIVQGVGTNPNYRDVGGGSFTGDYNVADDTSAPGGASWQSQTNVFVDETVGSEDLSLAAASQGDYDVATPFAGWVGTYPDLGTDIVGTTRTGVIDAGAWQTPITDVPPDLTYADQDLTELTSVGTITPTNGGDPPTACSVDGGGDALPTGLTLHNDGTITGTPADGTEGAYDVLINNSNAGGSGTDATLHIDVVAAIPVIGYVTPQLRATGVAVSISATNTGSSGTWTVNTGSLPTGLSINSGTGAITGTPTVKTLIAGTDVTIRCENSAGHDDFVITFGVFDLYTATIEATNGVGSDQTDAEFRVYESAGPLPPLLVYDDPIDATIRTPLDAAPDVSGGGTVTSYTKISGSLPPGIAFSATTGRFAGTPTASGTYGSIVIRATGPDGTDDFTVTIVVANIAPEIVYESPVVRFKGFLSTIDVVSAGGDDITYTLDAGSLPTGMSLNASTGQIYGTPTVNDTYTPTILATNGEGTDSFTPTIVIATFVSGLPGTRRTIARDSTRLIRRAALR